MQHNEMHGYINAPPLEERPELEGAPAHQADPEPEVHIPEGYKSVEEFLQEARDEFAADMEYDSKNREEGLKDLHFLAVDQWEEKVRAEREAAGRPCIEINTLPQFVGQVVGDRRMNRTAVRVLPKQNASVEIAEIRAGLIKSIESFSNADRVYDAALEDQVSGGIGNFRVAMEFADADVFEQDIFIRQIANPFAVVWDRMSVDPTARDAMHCFVHDTIPRKTYEARWGEKHPVPGDLGDQTTTGMVSNGWFGQDNVRLTEYWRILEKPCVMALMADGTVQDVTDKPVEEYAASVALGKDNLPRIRKTTKKFARMYLITGFSILEGPYDLPINRLPIIRVNGREVRVGERRVRFGLVRWARDPARMRNYWRSIAVEALAMAPKNQWLAEAKSVEGREDDFREAHLSNDPLLIYNDDTPAPQRGNGPQLPSAVLQEAQMNAQDIKDTTGIHDASLGVKSNEVSGKAIMARQREGDVATFIYHDNLNAAIQEAGDVINQLIDICYDTARTVRVLGEDEKPKEVKINDPADPKAVDILVGKYDVQISTGPSYTTQRMLSAEAMMEAIQVAPQLMEIAGDLIVESQDWPGARQIAERLKKAMPKELTQEEGAEPTPEEMQQKAMELQAQQAQQAAQEEQAEMQTVMAQLEIAEKEALVEKMQEDARRAAAEADKAEADAERAELELNADTLRIPGEIIANGGRPQPQEQNNNSGRNPGSKSGRRSRRKPTPRKG